MYSLQFADTDNANGLLLARYILNKSLFNLRLPKSYGNRFKVSCASFMQVKPQFNVLSSQTKKGKRFQHFRHFLARFNCASMVRILIAGTVLCRARSFRNFTFASIASEFYIAHLLTHDGIIKYDRDRAPAD